MVVIIQPCKEGFGFYRPIERVNLEFWHSEWGRDVRSQGKGAFWRAFLLPFFFSSQAAHISDGSYGMSSQAFVLRKPLNLIIMSLLLKTEGKILVLGLNFFTLKCREKETTSA